MTQDFEAPLGSARPWFESIFFEQQLDARVPDPQHREWVRQFREQGYLRIDGLLETELLDAVAGCYPWLFDPETKFEGPPHILQSINVETTRRLDAWGVHGAVRDLACHPRILEVLQMLYGRDPIPFQTLNFRAGSGQALHADSFHFESLPRGYMCGVWVALEDIHDDSGPLQYVPTSQRLGSTSFLELGQWRERGDEASSELYARYEQHVRKLIEASGLPTQRLTCPKGTVFVWSADLVHGGAPITRPGSRRDSQVTHYYFGGCTYFTPMNSNPELGEYWLRDVFDVRTGEAVVHELLGEPLEAHPTADAAQNLFHLNRPPILDSARDGEPAQRGVLSGRRSQLEHLESENVHWKGLYADACASVETLHKELDRVQQEHNATLDSLREVDQAPLRRFSDRIKSLFRSG